MGRGREMLNNSQHFQTKEYFKEKFSLVIKSTQTSCCFREFHETLVALYIQYTNSVIFPCLIPVITNKLAVKAAV